MYESTQLVRIKFAAHVNKTTRQRQKRAIDVSAGIHAWVSGYPYALSTTVVQRYNSCIDVLNIIASSVKLQLACVKEFND